MTDAALVGAARRRRVCRPRGGRGAWRWWLAAALAGAGLFSCTPGAPAQGHDDLTKGSEPMASGKMVLELTRSEVLCGETLALRAVISNPGSRPFTVRVGPVSPVTYELRAAAEDRVAGVFSQEERLEATRGGKDAPPVVEWKEEVAPGASKKISDDPALYAMGPLAPGRYKLVGKAPSSGGELASAAVDLTVEPARIGHLATLFCPFDGAMATAFDHVDNAGAVWMFQQETENQRVNSGVFFRRQKLEGRTPVDDVAVAIKTAPRTEGRWVAWLRGNTLGALSGWGNMVNGNAPPAAVELQHPKFVPPGFQMADGKALFVVAGMGANGATIQPFVVSHGAITKGDAAPLASNLPARILARYTAGNDGGRLQVVWAETLGPRTTIYTRDYSAGGKPLGAKPVELFARDATLQALELAPLVVARTSGAVQALFGPERRKGENRDTLTLVQIPLDGAAGGVGETVIMPPRETVTAWAISGWAVGEPVLLAQAGDTILRGMPQAAGRWSVLAEKAKGARFLQLAASTRGYWAAVWVDPAAGVQYAPDPDFRPVK